MNNGFTKLLCLLLSLCTLLSCFTVFSFASTNEGGQDMEDAEGEEKLVPTILYNRDYADGWGIYNGTGNEKSIQKGQRFFIDRELNPDFTYNYFARMEVVNSNDGFFQLYFQEAGYPKKMRCTWSLT